MGLCLTRSKDQGIVLKTSDGDITITVIRGNNAKLHVAAPDSVGVWRKELLDADNKLPARPRNPESAITDLQDLCLHRR